MCICVQYTLVNKCINDRAYIYNAGTKKQSAAVPAPQVITAPTLGLSGLSDGCINTVIFDLTMGGDGARWVGIWGWGEDDVVLVLVSVPGSS